MTLFDIYLAVDWSARNVPSPAKPTRDSLWVGEALAPGVSDPSAIGETYWSRRQACRHFLRERLVHHVEAGRRVFVGFDFAFGYPAGFAAALGLTGAAPPWRLVWDELTDLIDDADNNRSNRFEVAAELNRRCGGESPGPLWGCPVGVQVPMLMRKSPGFPYPFGSGASLNRLRAVDNRERRVQPIWKLYGPGSVGSQSLVGIPAVCRLRDDLRLAPVSQVWPFETGFTAPGIGDGPFILYVEIWPGLFPLATDTDTSIRDQMQMRSVVRWLAQHDAEGALAQFFARPADLSDAALHTCVAEEGWIFGVR